MYRIIIVFGFKCLLASIIFFVFGYFVNSFFRQIPDWLSITTSVALLALLIIGVYKKRKEAINAGKTVDDLPVYLQSSVYIYLILGCFLGYIFSMRPFEAKLTIDNGKDVPVEIVLPNGKKQTISSDSYIEVTIKTGKNTLLIDGEPKEIDVLETGRWLYNIDSLNRYVKTTVDYSSSDVFYRNATDADTEDTSSEIVTGTFFKIETDFLFESPESISVDKRLNRSGHVIKTVLLRFSPSSWEEDEEDDSEDEDS